MPSSVPPVGCSHTLGVQVHVSDQLFFRQSVLLLLFRSLGQEAKSPSHSSTEYKPGPQVQGGASSGLFGVSNCEILQRYKKTLPRPIRSLLGTGTREVLVYLLNECADKYPNLFVSLHSFPPFPSPHPTASGTPQSLCCLPLHCYCCRWSSSSPLCAGIGMRAQCLHMAHQ